jgi:cysteine-rich repeat protein
MCPGIGEIFPFVAQGADLLFSLDVPSGSVGTVDLTVLTGFTESPPYLMVLTSCDDATATAESTCSTISATNVSYTNETSATVRVYVSVDADGAGNLGTFGLEVDVHPLGCGDGLLDGSEECDDANIFPDDGCTPACTLEEGYACTTASPSICTSRPDDMICGNVMCPPLPAGAIGGSQVCCTPQQRCGMAYPLLFGSGCVERDQEGEPSEECPDEESIFLLPTLGGCCRPDGRCGLIAPGAGGNGCVERAEQWRNMVDGFGALFYTGPFTTMSCGAD